MRIRRPLVIILMLPIFVVVADKYLLGGILRNAFIRVITTAASANAQPMSANAPVPCDAVSKIYNLQLTRNNGTWHLTRTNTQPTGDSAATDNTGDVTALSSAQLRAEADVTDLYQVNSDGPTLTINNLHPDQSCSFSAVIDGAKNYFSAQNAVTTDIPTNPTVSNFRAYEQEDFLPIFGYHFVLPDGKQNVGPLEIPISQFVAQAEYATNVMGCRWYTFGDIMRNYVLLGKKTPGHACVMTFDDGERNNYDVAYPVLRYYGIKASFFIIPSQIGLTPEYMTWSQIDELFHDGNEIGLHTLAPDFGVLQGNGLVRFNTDISSEKELLESKGYPVRTFAYPLNGGATQTAQILEDNKYVGARDGEKPDPWRDRRSLTTSMDGDFIWHMFYYRPDHQIVFDNQGNAVTAGGPQSPQALGTILSYSTWWQFEEGYRVESGQPVVDNSYAPTAQSYGIVKLRSGETISNKFILSRTDYFTINLFMAELANSSPLDTDSKIIVSIDGVAIQNMKAGNNCIKADLTFCENYVSTFLNEGSHTLTIKAHGNQLFLDKFNIFSTVSIRDTYSIKIVEYGSGTPRQANANGVQIE